MLWTRVVTKTGKGQVDFKAQSLRSLRPPLIRAAWKIPRKSLEIGVRCVFGIFVFSCSFGILVFFAERRLLSKLHFLLCFSTNLNVLLAICMFVFAMEGLWDDLNLERLFVKTNDLHNEGYDVSLYLQCVSLFPTVSKLQNALLSRSRSPETMAPSLGFPRVEVQKIGRCFGQCFSQTSLEVLSDHFGTFFGGRKGMGSKLCLEGFFDSSDFCG